MTIEGMAKYLGIDQKKLELLRIHETTGSLPGNYIYLRDYLGTQLLQKQDREWNKLMEGVQQAKRRTATFEGTEVLLGKLQDFVLKL